MPWNHETNEWGVTRCTLADEGCGWSTKAKRYSQATALQMKHLRAEHPAEAVRVVASADAMFSADVFDKYVKTYGTTPPWHEESQVGDSVQTTAFRTRNTGTI